MNKDIQKKRILRFLKGEGKRTVDAFGIYQWIERCHFHAWWDLGHALASHIPPGSLNQDYHRRLDFLLSECRSKLNDQFIEIRREGSTKVHFVPKPFADICEGLGITFSGKAEQKIRLTYLDKKIAILEELDAAGCFLHFLETDKKQLIQWLDNHGFQHLTQGNIKLKEFPQRKRVRLRVPWNDIPILIAQIFAEARVEILRKSLLNTLFRTGVNWQRCLDYHGVRYGLDTTDPLIEEIRQAFIKICLEKGRQDLARRLS